MSTPTQAGQTPQQPGSASKKAAGHVTTPSHLGLASPAPRSVPSPAATRKDQAGKTPINHPTVSSTGSKTLGSTPMVHNLSQTGMTVSSSPGAQNASFGTPSAFAGLNIDLGSNTPGLSTLLAGGSAMMPTMSELGMPSRGGKKNEDEERRDKMRKVLKNIGRRKGRVSQDGIARIGRRVGLDIDVDNDSPEERARTMGNRAIGMAGERLLIDINLKQHVPQKVEVLVLEGADPDLPEFADPASQVLMNDLNVPDGLLLHSNLDHFARNLNRLARLDLLSRNGKVNCFRAIYGVYQSLKKLYDLEREAVKAQQGADAANAEATAVEEVLRKRSGKPTVHGNGRIGLALEYWTASATSKSPGDSEEDSAMEVDGREASRATALDSQQDIYRLHIEAESSLAPMHAALRVSDAWLPETFEVPAPDSGESLPWQDPPPTYVTDAASDGQGNVMAVDGSQRVPDLRFVAKLDPPVVLPGNTANLLISEGGIEPLGTGELTNYYDTLLDVDTVSIAVRSEPIEAEQRVLALRDGQEVDVTHRYVLDVSKPDVGYKLEKFYFSHPRQLINLLPILRQWAQVGALIKGAFGSQRGISPKVEPVAPVNGVYANGHTNGVNGDSMDLDDKEETNEDLLVNVGLSVLPQPTISVTMPNLTSSDVSNTIFQIMPNASVAVTSYDGMGEKGDSPAQDGAQTDRAKKLAKALEVCGDLGVWVEWMRKM